MDIRPVTGGAKLDQAQIDQAQMDQAQMDRDSRQALLCRASSRIVALPIASVLETMRPQPVQPLPGLPGYVRGVSMIRGVPVPVVNLARLLGPGNSSGKGMGAARDSADSARFVTVRAGGTVALAVDAVLDVRSLDDDASGHLPPLLGGVDRGLVASLGSLDPELLYVLEATHLVGAQFWEELEAASVQSSPAQGSPAEGSAVQSSPVPGAAS